MPHVAPGMGHDMGKRQPPDEFAEIAGQINQMVGQLWRWHFGEFSGRESWQPPVNVYQVDRCLEVCVELAGMQRQQIDVQVEPGRLVIRGIRQAPEPTRRHKKLRILSMEVDHGPFCRVIRLPDQVDLARVQSNYDQGMLWIHLPLREPG
jgi:HSP20 family protein